MILLGTTTTICAGLKENNYKLSSKDKKNGLGFLNALKNDINQSISESFILVYDFQFQWLYFKRLQIMAIGVIRLVREIFVHKA